MRALAVGGAALLFVACPRSSGDRPVVSLASSTTTDARFAAIRLRWSTATAAERAAMRQELSDLIALLAVKRDGLEPLARAYLAIAWLDAGVPAAADAIASVLADGPPGVAHDLAVLVRGAAARRAGHPDNSLELLQPLVGKLIDRFARPILYEEMTEALIDVKRFDEAIVFADAWLRASEGSDHAAARATIARVLRRIPQDAIDRALLASRQTRGGAGYSPEIMLMLGAQLDELGADMTGDDAGVEGVAAGDASTGDGASGGSGGSIALDRVAPTPAPVPIGAPVPNFDPLAIAFLVPSSVAGYGASATAVARAASEAISPLQRTPLAPSPAPPLGPSLAIERADAGTAAPPPTSTHRLTVFDTGGTPAGVARAVEYAERAGAAVVVGGVLDVEANALARLAQSRHIPVIVLRAPTAPPPVAAGDRRWFITLGPSVTEERATTAALANALPGEHVVVDAYPEPGAPAPPIGEDPLRSRCDAVAKTVDDDPFPIAAWRARKVPTVVVLGDAHCVDRVAATIAAPTSAMSKTAAPKVPYRPRLVAAPSGLEIVHQGLPFERVSIGAGLLPATDDAPPALRALWAAQRGPVGWWGGLGHDASVIASTATPGDPARTREATAIAHARAVTLGRLFAARADLWTTTYRGADETGTVRRTTHAVTVGGEGAWEPAWVGR